VTGGVNLDNNNNNNNNNNKIRKEVQKVGKKTFVSEIQEFDKPEGYEDAFKNYYPKQK
jgi:hypothetical protein